MHFRTDSSGHKETSNIHLAVDRSSAGLDSFVCIRSEGSGVLSSRACIPPHSVLYTAFQQRPFGKVMLL